MEKRYQLVTNNSKVLSEYTENTDISVDYLIAGNFLEVLIRVRDRIQSGWHLLSHPQASNLKPNQCPYKTILISQDIAAESFARDEELIELAISAYHKFTDGMVPPQWNNKANEDFKTVDLSVINSAVNSSLMHQMMLGNCK
jgi:hypothetical protein